MPSTLSDYLQRQQGGLATLIVGSWVQLVNNVTSTAYVSTSATDATGKYTVLNVPAGIYTVNTGPTNTGPWTATGDTSYIVADLPGFYNVVDFGASPTGTAAANTTAIQSALTAAGAAGGGRVFIPAGVYQINAGTLTISSDNVEIEGAGWQSQLQVVGGSGNAITVQAPGGGVFRYGIRFADFYLNCNSVASVNGIDLQTTYHAQLIHVRIRFCSGTSVFCDGSGGNVGAYTNITDCTISDGTTAASIGILSNFHEWITIKGGTITFFNVAGAVAIKSQSLNNRVIGVGIDNNDTGIWQVFAGRLVVAACQFDRGQTHFIRLQGAQFCTIVGNAFCNFNGSGSKNVIDVDDGNNKANLFIGNSLLEGAGWTDWIAENANTGTPGNLYEANDFGTLAAALVTGTARNNRGFNPQGVAAITVTASPFTYTNNDGVDEMVSIDGGTITTVAKNAITLYSFGGTAARCAVFLKPGEAVTVTYTGAPSMNKDRK